MTDKDKWIKDGETGTANAYTTNHLDDWVLVPKSLIAQIERQAVEKYKSKGHKIRVELRSYKKEFLMLNDDEKDLIIKGQHGCIDSLSHLTLELKAVALKELVKSFENLSDIKLVTEWYGEKQTAEEKKR